MERACVVLVANTQQMPKSTPIIPSLLKRLKMRLGAPPANGTPKPGFKL